MFLKKENIIFFIYFFTFLSMQPSFALETVRDKNGNLCVANQIIVKFKDPNKSIQDFNSFKINAKSGAEGESSSSIFNIVDKAEPVFKRKEVKPLGEGESSTSSVARSSQVHLVKLKENIIIDQAIEAFKSDPNVEYVEKNYIFEYQEEDFFVNKVIPPNILPGGNDHEIKALYGLDILQVNDIWKYGYEGQNVTVAVIDSGVDISHRDLSSNIFYNAAEIKENNLDDDKNGYVDDYAGYNFFDSNNNPFDSLGHGTHKAGIIAALGNNGIGTIGVAPKAKILSLRVGDHTGAPLDKVSEAIVYAADLTSPANPNKSLVNVINISLGAYVYNTPYNQLITLAYSLEYAKSRGVVVIAAAGNDDVNIDDVSFVPAGFDSVISVAAIDDKYYKASFSNYGTFVDISAPGVNILSLKPPNLNYSFGVGVSNSGNITYNDNNGEYAIASGTSSSAPFVSGVAALILSKRSDLSVSELTKVLNDSLGAPVVSFDNKPIPDVLTNAGIAIRDVCKSNFAKCDGTCKPAEMCCREGCPLCKNPLDTYDVDGDGFISPLDVLVIINLLNSENGGGFYSCTSAPFYDVSGDGYVSPIDVLITINHINSLKI